MTDQNITSLVNDLKERLERLADRDRWSDNEGIDPNDYYGANFNDAYGAGVNDGETGLARSLLKDYFGVDNEKE
jgi:hypothetical protein